MNFCLKGPHNLDLTRCKDSHIGRWWVDVTSSIWCQECVSREVSVIRFHYLDIVCLELGWTQVKHERLFSWFLSALPRVFQFLRHELQERIFYAVLKVSGIQWFSSRLHAFRKKTPGNLSWTFMIDTKKPEDFPINSNQPRKPKPWSYTSATEDCHWWTFRPGYLQILTISIMASIAGGACIRHGLAQF